MSNGDCPVGSANAANIVALSRVIETACSGMLDTKKELTERVNKVESKQDWMLYLLIANLVAVLLNYIV